MCGIIRIIYHAFEEVNPTSCIEDITHTKRIWVEWIKVLIKRFRFSYCKTMLQMLWLQNIFCNAKNILPWTNQSWTDFMIDNFEKNLTNSGLSFTSSTYVDLYISRYDFDYFSI